MPKHQRRPLIFFTLTGFAVLLLLSWVMPLTRQAWDAIDKHAFYFLNGWLAENHLAQLGWAVANYRPFDLVPLSIMILSITVGDFFLEEKDLPQKQTIFFALFVIMIIIRNIVGLLYGEGRHSPSTVLQPAYLLHELVPYIAARDHSFESFPGDHAAYLFTWLGFMLIYAKKPYKFVAFFFTALFTMPRLVSGSHWISDDFVGSAFVTLLAIAFTCYTPIADFSVRLLLPLALWFNRVKPKLRKQRAI